MNCLLPLVFLAEERASRPIEKPARRAIRSTILLVFALSLFATITGSAPAQTTVAPSETAAYFEDLRSHSRYQRARERAFRSAEIQGGTTGARRTDPRSQITRGIRTSHEMRQAAYYEAARASTRRPTDRRSRGNNDGSSIERHITDRLIRARLNPERISLRDSKAATPRDDRLRNVDLTRSGAREGRVSANGIGRLGSFGPATPGRIRPSYFSSRSFGDGDRGNVRIGPIDVRVGTSTFVEFNDNILRSSSEKLSDVIVGQKLDLQARWQLNERNSLDFNLGVGIERFLQNSDRAPTSQNGYDLYVTPDSAISYDIFLGNATLNLHDRFSSDNRTRDDFTLDDAQVVDSYTNAAGAALFIPINSRLDASVGYDFVTVRSLDEIDDATSSNSHQYFADVGYSPHGTWRVGFQASGASTDYLDSARADARTTNTGAYIDLPLSHFTTVRASGGYQSIKIDDVEGAAGNFTGTYGRIAITNQLNRFITQSFSYGSQADLGVFSDIRVTRSAQYRLDYRGNDGDELYVGVSYEKDDDRGSSASGSSSLDNSFPILEDRTNVSANFLYRRPLSRNLRAALGGGYSRSTTGLGGRSFDRWTANAELQYALSDKVSAGIGYTYTTVEAEDAQGFVQNRVILNLNYLF